MVAAALASTVLGAGCATLGFGGRLPALELYRLRVPDGVVTSGDGEAAPAPRARGAIAIAPYSAPGLYGDRGIVFRIGESEYGAYPNREWALPVPTMLGLITEDVLKARPVTTEEALFDPPSRRAYPYVWRGLVRELEEVDRGKQVFASVALEARIVRSSDDSVLWSGTVRLERPVPVPTMTAIVDSLSSISAAAIARLAGEARAALARPAASAGAAPR